MSAMEARVRDNRIVLPIGTAVGFKMVTNNHQKIDLKIIESQEESKFRVLFDQNDVDFEIEINNLKCIHGIGWTMVVNNGFYDYYLGPKEIWSMEALYTRGRKLHFISKDSEEGRNVIEDTARDFDLSYSESAAVCSRIEFTFEVEKSRAKPKRELEVNSLEHSRDVFDRCTSDSNDHRHLPPTGCSPAIDSKTSELHQEVQPLAAKIENSVERNACRRPKSCHKDRINGQIHESTTPSEAIVAEPTEEWQDANTGWSAEDMFQVCKEKFYVAEGLNDYCSPIGYCSGREAASMADEVGYHMRCYRNVGIVEVTDELKALDIESIDDETRFQPVRRVAAAKKDQVLPKVDYKDQAPEETVEDDEMGAVGVVCFGQQSNQFYNPYEKFTKDEDLVIKPFVVELRFSKN